MKESRSILAIALCVVFYLGYEYYLKSKYADFYDHQQKSSEAARQAPAASTPPVAGSAATATAASPASPATPEVETARLSPEELVVETDTTIYRFSQESGGLASVRLKDYRAGKSDDSELVELIDGGMALQGSIDPNQRTALPTAFSAERDGRTLRFSRQVGDFRIAQEYQVPDRGYGLPVRLSFTNTGSAAIDLTAGLAGFVTLRHKKSENLVGFIPGVVSERDQLIYRVDGSTEWHDFEGFCRDNSTLRTGNLPVDYFGFDRHYFLAVLTPKAKSQSLRFEPTQNIDTVCSFVMTSFDKQGYVEPGQTVTVEYDGYFGPKDRQVLEAYQPVLETSIHTGIFSFIARPLLAIIEGFYRATGNYGVAIVLLTILLKIVFYPLMRASSVSMHKMKRLNPQMQALREKYKDDRQKQQQELMKFMAQNKINPMQGCLPILPQIPVFFAFYQVLQTSIQLRHAPFFGWIQDLSAMDPYFVTPLLMGVAMVVQQKLTPTTGMDKTQEKILMFMPVMFTVMMLTLPAGLTLYMLTNTVVGIIQQQWLYRRLDKLAA